LNLFFFFVFFLVFVFVFVFVSIGRMLGSLLALANILLSLKLVRIFVVCHHCM
jgi:hypothetical protein